MTDLFGQGGHQVRLDWGPTGAVVARADIAVVVDVLSFSTSVTVAVERGMRVYPYRWRDERAGEYAASRDAVLAVGRLEAARSGATPAPSLSPAGLLRCAPAPRLVLPSPNGSTIAAALAGAGSRVVVGCLRNARAVARWLVPELDAGHSVVVVAAGERWTEDDSLRPALEDHLGAGAVVSALAATGHGSGLSPEARAAAELFDVARTTLTERLRDCVGGRELYAKGFGADVDVAAAFDVCDVVPVLEDEAFAATSR
ncbi:2-phosphosulfolactate phosphatase [Nocardioides zeae]|uniref:Probable 2-phosphosulfolactate phosphatase n=1 Tax=Nocardioides imazamoxiresistens TaxID=3231893 RepID=A0ABU3PSY5_9ACTN|nr:2-phosphosulfolactate phosphatase [Nocardioides zeae]MDT9592352.1 2-phosphosulfolactate phosphatase [Nocardioides zeae]